MNQPIIVIEEVLGRSKQGMTLPFICRGSDGEVYYVKGAGAGRRSQICEWVAMQLGARFGLPIATSILAEVPLELIDSKVRSDIGDLGDVRDTIPASWWNVDDGVCADVSWEEIVTCLERFQSTKFWDMS